MDFDSSSKFHAQEARPSGERIDPRSSDVPASRSDLETMIAHDVLKALHGMQFGEVTIIVRDGQIVQIDRVARDRQTLPKQSSPRKYS